jgi:hypothetical protein
MEIKLYGIEGKDADWARKSVEYAVKLLSDAKSVHQISIEWENEDENKVIITVMWNEGGYSAEERRKLNSGFMETFNCHAEFNLDRNGEELETA